MAVTVAPVPRVGSGTGLQRPSTVRTQCLTAGCLRLSVALREGRMFQALQEISTLGQLIPSGRLTTGKTSDSRTTDSSQTIDSKTTDSSQTTGTSSNFPRTTGTSSNFPRTTGTSSNFPKTTGTSSNFPRITGTSNSCPRTTGTSSNPLVKTPGNREPGTNNSSLKITGTSSRQPSRRRAQGSRLRGGTRCLQSSSPLRRLVAHNPSLAVLLLSLTPT